MSKYLQIKKKYVPLQCSKFHSWGIVMNELIVGRRLPVTAAFFFCGFISIHEKKYVTLQHKTDIGIIYGLDSEFIMGYIFSGTHRSSLFFCHSRRRLLG